MEDSRSESSTQAIEFSTYIVLNCPLLWLSMLELNWSNDHNNCFVSHLRPWNRTSSGSDRVNCYQPSSTQPILVPSPKGLTTISYCLATLGGVQLFPEVLGRIAYLLWYDTDSTENCERVFAATGTCLPSCYLATTEEIHTQSQRHTGKRCIRVKVHTRTYEYLTSSY
jgi:hypothetical protein